MLLSHVWSGRFFRGKGGLCGQAGAPRSVSGVWWHLALPGPARCVTGKATGTSLPLKKCSVPVGLAGFQSSPCTEPGEHLQAWLRSRQLPADARRVPCAGFGELRARTAVAAVRRVRGGRGEQGRAGAAKSDSRDEQGQILLAHNGGAHGRHRPALAAVPRVAACTILFPPPPRTQCRPVPSHGPSSAPDRCLPVQAAPLAVSAAFCSVAWPPPLCAQPPTSLGVPVFCAGRARIGSRRRRRGR